jgi:hypothetical protein
VSDFPISALSTNAKVSILDPITSYQESFSSFLDSNKLRCVNNICLEEGRMGKQDKMVASGYCNIFPFPPKYLSWNYVERSLVG